jgi:hypothetical protein
MPMVLAQAERVASLVDRIDSSRVSDTDRKTNYTKP